MKVQLVSNGSTGAGNGVPTLVTQGKSIRRGGANLVAGDGFDDLTDEAACLVEAAVTAAAAGTVEFVRLWGWFPDAIGDNKWFPLGDGVAADKGKLSPLATTAYLLVETGTDIIRHVERIRGLRECSRVYAQYGTLTNITRIDVTLVARGQTPGGQ